MSASRSAGGLGKYRKVKLVPFGEFVPARNKLPFLNKYQIRETDVIPGEKHNLISTDYGDIGIIICFESLFPAITREMANNGADLLFVLTNDSWFKDSFAAKQHLYFSVLRAVESRRSIVRSAATGISALINPYGKILSKTNIFEETILSGKTYIAKDKKTTIYTKYGDWFVYLCFILFFICLLIKYVVLKNYKNGCGQIRNHPKLSKQDQAKQPTPKA
ncbi:MAG: apolipoprotein N-acyltransferase [Armatimonadota bacterium]